jgi:hypothetical protein
MAINWALLFENFGIKEVTNTDKAKGAYVPTAQQVYAIRAAGVKPSDKRPADDFRITVLNDPARTSVNASFYHSLRQTDPSRVPEPRMGHAFISSWLQVGDIVVIGNIGDEVFAAKDNIANDEASVRQEAARKAKPSTILALAQKAEGKPAKKVVVRQDFQRNPFVVAAAIHRSKGKCEMPGCKRELFSREDETPYLEVHHVVPLGEDGDDTLANVAALCPHCHRELHHGKERAGRRQSLAKHISSLK